MKKQFSNFVQDKECVFIVLPSTVSASFLTFAVEISSCGFIYQKVKKAWYRSSLKVQSMRQFVATESPLNMIRNAFHVTLKALFFLRYLNFVLICWSCRKTA